MAVLWLALACIESCFVVLGCETAPSAAVRGAGQGQVPCLLTVGQPAVSSHAHGAAVALSLHAVQVRGQPGVQALQGVDSLAVHLLACTGSRAELRELLQQPTHALLGPLQPVLEAHGCLDALGLLQAARGHSQLALSTWQVWGTLAGA